MSFRLKFSLVFLFLYMFRVAFGLSKPFFSPDEMQTYLIGLKVYTTGAWPFFGPDLIVTETGFYTQIPGALEGLLLGLPFFLLPIPEAPFLFLNLLTTGALAFFSWYLSKRLRGLSFYFIFPWLSLLPWNLHESTNPINPSFLLIGSSFFFVGFLEALPGLTLKWLKPSAAFALMGLGLFWNMQFHYSWVLLPPFILGAFILRWRAGFYFKHQGKDLVRRFRPTKTDNVSTPIGSHRSLSAYKNSKSVPGFKIEILGLAAGAAVPLAFLIPTFLKYGFAQGAGGMSLSVGFNPGNFLSFFTVLARYLSLPCFELPRFIALSSEARMEFFKAAPWLILPGFFLILLGWLQPFLLLAAGLWQKAYPACGVLASQGKEAAGMERLTLVSFLWVWTCFWFTSKEPAAHMYYILLPLVAAYSLYVWVRLSRSRFWRLFGIACIMASLWFQGGWLVRMMPVQSLYFNRPQVVKALKEKDHRILGQRRPGSIN